LNQCRLGKILDEASVRDVDIIIFPYQLNMK